MGNHSLGTYMLFLSLFVCQIPFGCCRKAYSNISCNESERRALLDFRKSLIDKSNRLSSWTGENCCKWKGIGCNTHTGRIMKLDLRNPNVFDDERYHSDKHYQSYYHLGLGGEISPSLLHLEYLQHMDLSCNNFSGIQIPQFFGSFKYMRYLNLSYANFGGQIPSHLGNLSRLQYLDLGHNNDSLSAQSLWWITGITSLKGLSLSHAYLYEADDWLHAINMHPSLLSLDLGSCTLNNPNPSSSFHINLSSLVSLDLTGNIYMGESLLPLWLFNITSIQNFYLQSTTSSLTLFLDALPNLIGKLTSLTVLDLSLNQFHTTILNSLCTLTSLTNIDLSVNYFQGKLPLCLENLTSLTVLQLRSNRFRGTIPFQISHLGKLTELDLSQNKLEGIIPSSLGQLTELERLQISQNRFFGRVPPNLGKLENLQSLDISRNSFAGELTEIHFQKLTELKSLDISWNFFHLKVSSQWSPPFQLLEIFMDGIQVGPQFPPWLETQKGVASLGMSNANISDEIPNWFEVVYSRLTYLDLSFNQITGEPPEIKGSPFSGFYGKIDLSFNKFLGSLKSIPTYVDSFFTSNNSLTGQIPSLDGDSTSFPLSDLILDDNGLTGAIPSTICNTRTLRILDLSSNHLSGEIPFCLGNLRNLWLLNLANNRLFGQIPGSLGNLRGLLVLHLTENKFHGEIPLSLRNLKYLITLDLGDNQLSGTLPRWSDKELQNLVWLRLQSNNFSGDIPLELCQLSSLQMLNLARNNFNGVIPHCFGNFSAMAGSKHFSGFGLPDYEIKRQFFSNLVKGGDLKYSMGFLSVRSIALSENKIVGEIPNELMDLVGLQSLTLSKNHLHGRIPENIGNLKSLESLDLSLNELSGSIPLSLATIDTLGYLNLSFNKLSGQIPRGNHFQTFDDPSIYEGNKGLCGKPLSYCIDDKPWKEGGPLNLHHGESSDIWFYAGIGPGFAVGLLGVFSVLILKKSWRYAYFRFVENLWSSSMWVQIVVKFSLLWRKFKRVNVQHE